MILSIIVPVYNVEEYIIQCLDSLIEKKYNNIEIILIDDGSKDSSGIICEEYKNKFNNIKVIHKKNGGLSDARNCGIENSNGKYLMFVDSDDYISCEGIQSILDVIENNIVDVLMYTYYEFEKFNKFDEIFGKCTELDNGYYKTNNIILSKILKNTSELWPAWKYIVRKDFLLKNNIKFKKGFLHEDVDYTARLMSCMNNFYYLDKPIYYYRVNREGSIMNSKSVKSLLDTSRIIIDLKEFFENNNIDNEIFTLIMDRLSRTYFTVLSLYSKGNYEEKKIIIKNIKENSYLLDSSTSIKHRIFSVISKILGIRTLLNLYTKVLG
ncbi:glycosyltransferase [Clostridium perfringens]|nr:glycosyltransferase [Clostridium perfringens]